MIKPKKTIQNIKPYKTDKYHISYDYKLDSNENFYGISKTVFNTIRNFNPDRVSLYPCYGELTDKLSLKYNLDDDNILLTNGCDEALNLLISAYIEENDEILSYFPSFSMPLLYAEVQGAQIKQISYDKKFVFDEVKFQNNITDKTKMAYIATPNNPTGEVVLPSSIEFLLQKFPNTLFIVDCTYVNFSFKVNFSDYVKLLKYDNVAIVKSFSKDFALAGLRLGFILANNNIISNLKKVSSPYNVNAIVLECAINVLNNEFEFEKVKQDNKTSLDMLYDGLLKSGYKPYPSEGNFILCDFLDHKDFIYSKLKSNGIILRNYSKDSILSTCLRITVPNKEGVKKILELIKPRPLFVFDLDGVVFDVSQSYRQAIIKTFEHFTGYCCSESDIQNVKHLGGMSNDWKVTKYLLDKEGLNISYEKTVEVFQNLFFDESKPIGKRGLVDNEKLVFNSAFYNELLKTADCAVFTSRDEKEAFYSLEKFDIKKYFSYFICSEQVGTNPKPSPFGLNEIKKHCPYSEIFYFGDTIDDIKAGFDAKVNVFGIIPPSAPDVEQTIEKLFEYGAKAVFKNPNEILNSDLIKQKEVQCG